MAHDILLIGGHGKVALLATPLLRERGHRVDAVIRNPNQTEDVQASGAEAVVGDVEAMDVQALTEMVRGHDVVIWSAGAGGGSPARTNAVDREAAIRTMQAAQAAGARRFIMVSYYSSGVDDVPEANSFHHYARAKADADEYLRGTDLDWTILGPSLLTLDPPTGSIEIGPEDGSGQGSQVTRADVAAVIAEALEQPATIRRTIRFNNGDQPIAEALTAPTD